MGVELVDFFQRWGLDRILGEETKRPIPGANNNNSKSELGARVASLLSEMRGFFASLRMIAIS